MPFEFGALHFDHGTWPGVILIPEPPRQTPKHVADVRIVNQACELDDEGRNAAGEIFQTKVQIIGILRLVAAEDRMRLHDQKWHDAGDADFRGAN